MWVLPGMFSKSGVTKPVGNAARLRQHAAASKSAAPPRKHVGESLGVDVKRSLREQCTNMPRGSFPDLRSILSAFTPAALNPSSDSIGQFLDRSKANLDILMPEQSSIFVHRGLNKGSCAALGGKCLGNYTLLRQPSELVDRFSWDRCAVVGNSGSLLITRYGFALDASEGAPIWHTAQLFATLRRSEVDEHCSHCRIINFYLVCILMHNIS
ncbi:hypothetical protein CYMTET_47581 [Cymbomonas tetramitiformis]|uniref:Uncharacterized protein n=1 Tax=Cymbomonas tetramitiformis TaxID=36881 RepID=A0AAE0BTZ8_9CHLO|nr:hypothetical protein CYMTET_47581 [Cymbomonas tetramitiformis]